MELKRCISGLAPHAKTTVLVACVFWLTAVLALGIALARERGHLLRQAREDTWKLAAVFDEYMSRTFGGVDIALLGISDYFAARDLPRHDEQARAYLREYLTMLPAVRGIFIIGPDGFIRHDTDYPRTPDVSLMDREYFRQYLERETLMKDLSSAVQSRSGSDWFAAMTRRIVGPDGEFKGVAVAAVQLDALAALYRSLNLRDGQRMSLYHVDGRLIARHPADDASIGQSFAYLPVFSEHLPRDETGIFTTDGPPFFVPRIVSYRKLERLPLVVVLSNDKRTVLDAWRHNVADVVAAVLALSLLSAWGMFLYIQRQRQMARTAKLQQAEAEASALAQANAKFRIFFEQGRHLSLVISCDGKILEANDEILRNSGFTREQVIGHDFWNGAWWSGVPDQAARVRDGFEQALNGKIFTGEASYARADGKQSDVELVLSPILGENGQVLAVAAVAMDITERKRKEEKLLALAEELAHTDRQKGEFLATLSHEVRNVLAPLQTSLDLLERTPADSPVHQRAKRIVQSQLDQMRRLFDDLMDVARINSGRIHLECKRVDLREVLEDVAESAQTFIEPAGQDFRSRLPDAPLWVDADVERMHQVFTNLLSNAAKYTAQGGHIELSACREGNEAVVRVTDDGMGIPEDEQARIFEMFEQVPTHRAQAKGGLGIGLALVHKLVALHGGRVEAFSRGAGTGSTFTVRLPLQERQAAADEAAAPNARADA